MRYGYFEGITTYLLPRHFQYSLLLLIVSYYTLISFPPVTMLSNYSGDDLVSMCNVASIQKDSLLFIYVPQVIVSFVFFQIYYNPDTYLSGVFQAKLQS
jgi:hypothetical protein